MLEKGKNRGQIAVFVILALVIIGAVLAIIYLRGNLTPTGVPAEFQEVFDGRHEVPPKRFPPQTKGRSACCRRPRGFAE